MSIPVQINTQVFFFKVFMVGRNTGRKFKVYFIKGNKILQIDLSHEYWYNTEKVACRSRRDEKQEDFSMAENKQYITQAQDNGTVMISEEVVAAIVTQAAKDVEGVVSLGGKPGVDPKKLWSRDLKITISETNEVSVDCNIVIAYGSTVVTVAKAVQDAVYGAIESMTGVKPVSVNINVCGIVRQ